MDEKYLILRKEADYILREMSIADSDADINNILFELKETDDSDLDIKIKTLEEIKNLINIKHKISIKNNDLYFLKNIAEQLRLDEKNGNTSSLIKVINKDKEENFFITQKDANDYINSLKDKNDICVISVENKELNTLLNIIKRNF